MPRYGTLHVSPFPEVPHSLLPAKKRHKQLPLRTLTQNMQEASIHLEDSLLRKMLERCGDAENHLALELSQHEVFVKKEIVAPLYSITEMEIPDIQKQRKQLAKLVLDWDFVRTRVAPGSQIFRNQLSGASTKNR